MLDAVDIAQFLINRFGLSVTADSSRVAEGQLIIIRPAGIPHTIGFTVNYIAGWRSLDAQFLPGPFASDLVDAMCQASPAQKTAFKVFADAVINEGAELQLIINGNRIDPQIHQEWPFQWLSVELRMRKGSLVFEDDILNQRNTVYPWLARFFGMTIALLPLESAEQDKYEAKEEGAEYFAKVKRYERSQINRAACIEIHGLRCLVCGLKLSDKYGQIGRDFIHVHHVEPLSMMESSYVVNPATDLVPVCPNCHTMMHRKNPPYSVEELRNLMGRSED